MDSVSTVSFMAKEVYVFQIPPRTNSAGHKATAWDVNKPLWRGRLRVLTGETACMIRLEDSTTGELFAECPYDKTGLAVEQVLDSSRYFVFRVQEGAGGRKAYIGVGFVDRSEAFDFNIALEDYRRSAQTFELAAPEGAVADGPAGHVPSDEFRLREGQKITVNLSGMRKKKPAPEAEPDVQDLSAMSENPFFIPPPPRGRRR